MMPLNRDLAYLWDMHKACCLLLDFVKGINYSEYMSDILLQSAVERQLEIIGEAARRLSSAFQETHSEIPWRKLIGLRNLLIHEYGEIKPDRIWLVVADHIPGLIEVLHPLLPPEN